MKTHAALTRPIRCKNLLDSASAGRQRYYKVNWAQTLPVRAPDVRFYLRRLRNLKQMSERPVLKRKRRPASAAHRCALMSLARCQIPCFNYGPTAKLERFCWPWFSRSEAGNTTADARATSKVEKTTFAAVSVQRLRAPWPDQRRHAGV